MSHILTGSIEPRFFHDQHVPEGDVKPQLIVEGVPFPDFVRACLQVQGLAVTSGVVEGGPFRFGPARIAERNAGYAQPARYSDRLPDRWNTYTLHVCECGDAGCSALFGSVLPYVHEGAPGLLIDKCWGRSPDPYPVPSIFLPDRVRDAPVAPRGAVLPAEALQPTPYLTFLLGGDVQLLLAAYERERQDSRTLVLEAADKDPEQAASEAFARLFGGAAKA